MSELAQHIEALLFYAAEPVSFKMLGELCDASPSAIAKALEELQQSYNGRALELLVDAKTAALVTKASASSIIERMVKKDREAPLSNAACEVLAIVAYAGPIAKSEIDFIRGVNSQYTLRALSMRGLVAKEAAGTTPRYSGTVELMAFLGIASWNDLPKKEELITTYQSMLAKKDAAEAEAV